MLKSVCFIAGLLIAATIIFALGRRWESYCIRNSLQKTGVAVSRWGDVSKVRITGKAQDL